MPSLPPKALHHLRQVLELPDLTGTKYRLVQKIASGGMGSVYLTEDASLKRNVALKVLNIPSHSDEMRQRLLQEAHIVARLEHPGIVPIHDVGTLPDDRVFYTMKFVQGQRLDEYAQTSRSLPDLLRIFQKICEAVSFAHANGVLHRDLKPENIMVGSFGEVLVMDWGVAKVLEHPQALSTLNMQLETLNSTQTLQGTIIGTPAYMSPEQARGETESLTAQTDIYALGAILYILLTGRPPFQATDPQTVREQVIAQSLTPPRHIDPKISKAIESVCLKAMAKAPGDRYMNVQDISADVAHYLDGLPVSSYKESLFERLDRWVQANRFIVFLLIAYLLMRLFTFLITSR